MLQYYIRHGNATRLVTNDDDFLMTIELLALPQRLASQTF